jgi:hypothetical protein
MYICHATGAFPYMNVKFRWKEILGARQDLDATARVWSPLTNAFQKLDFKFLDHVDSKFACSIRQDGRLEGLRSSNRMGCSIGHVATAPQLQVLCFGDKNRREACQLHLYRNHQRPKNKTYSTSELLASRPFRCPVKLRLRGSCYPRPQEHGSDTCEPGS